jgi:hypothetical protein
MDPYTEEVISSIEAVNPFSLDGGFGVPRPALAAESNDVFVTDPSNGKITKARISESGKLGIVDTFDVGGKPTRITIVGTHN